jgi:hypothetical protein
VNCGFGSFEQKSRTRTDRGWKWRDRVVETCGGATVRHSVAAVHIYGSTRRGTVLLFSILEIATFASVQWFWSLDEATRAALIGAAAAFVAALIAAAATFVTAVITLVSVGIGLYVNRLSQQEERRLTLRREVYLSAAKRYAASTQVLGSMADPFVDIRATASPIVGEFAAAVAQIQLVGDERAIPLRARL